MSIKLDQNEFHHFGKFFAIPQDPHDKDILESVDNKTRVDVDLKYGIMFDYTWHANTVALGVMESIITDLSHRLKMGESRNGIGCNFFDLFSASVSIKKNEKAEKEGNINIYFKPGDRAMKLITDGPSEAYKGPILNARQEFTTGDAVCDNYFRDLDRHTRYQLQDYHSLTIKDSQAYTEFAVAYIFFENLFAELLFRLSNSEGASEEDHQELVSVNFNDIVEFHALQKDGGVTFTMRPGLNAKLLIKNDGMTENTLGSLDDSEEDDQ